MSYPVERLLEVNEDVIEVLQVLEVLLAQYPKVEDLLCCAIYDIQTLKTLQILIYNY